jgi:hypothetical protein
MNIFRKLFGRKFDFGLFTQEELDEIIRRA